MNHDDSARQQPVYGLRGCTWASLEEDLLAIAPDEKTRVTVLGLVEMTRIQAAFYSRMGLLREIAFIILSVTDPHFKPEVGTLRN